MCLCDGFCVFLLVCKICAYVYVYMCAFSCVGVCVGVSAWKRQRDSSSMLVSVCLCVICLVCLCKDICVCVL